MKLFIVGNGFDLYHGLPTTYNGLMFFLSRKESEVHKNLIKFIKQYSISHFNIDIEDENFLWCEFEDILGTIEPLELAEHHRDWNSTNNYTGPPSIELVNLLEFGMNTGKYLSDWISEINKLIVKIEHKDIIKELISKNDLILSFNYTLTLEKVYDIPKSNVIHIHGSNKNKLVMGHSSDYNVITDPNDFGINVINERYIKKFFSKSLKKTNNIINMHRYFFNSEKLEKVSEVIVLGHSLGIVDKPYFEEIIKEIQKNTFWTIVYYNVKDINYIKIRCRELNICNNYKLLHWSELSL